MPDKKTTDGQADIAAALGNENQQNQPGWDATRAARDNVAGLNKTVRDLKNENEQLRQQLESAPVVGNDDDGDIDTFDGVQKALKQNQEALAKVNEQLEAANSRVSQLESNVTMVSTTANTQAGLTELDRMCRPLDKEFGPQHRTAALENVEKRFQELGIADLKPSARKAWVQNELQTEYGRLSSSGKTNSGSGGVTVGPIVSDTASGGSGNPRKGATIQEGDLNSVVEQYRKSHSK